MNPSARHFFLAMLMTACLQLLLAKPAFFGQANGFYDRKLLSLQDVANAHNRMLLTANNDHQTDDENVNEEENQPSEQGVYSKKSALTGLKRFNGSGSRNCFFTPIQCMIQHDMAKYKKLVEYNSGMMKK